MFMLSLLATASAGPLHDIAQIELTNAREIHRMVQSAQAMERQEVSKTCLEADAKAKSIITEARALFDADKKRDGYFLVHTAVTTLRPCADEFSKGNAKSFQYTLKAVMRSGKPQIQALDAHLATKSTEPAKAARNDAEKLAQSGRDHMLAGETTEAVADWYATVDAIFKAVKAST